MIHAQTDALTEARTQEGQPGTEVVPVWTRPRVLIACGGMVVVAGNERMTAELVHGLVEAGLRVHCIVNDWENHRIVSLMESAGATWSTGFYNYSIVRRGVSIRERVRMIRNILATSSGMLRTARDFKPTHVLFTDFVSVLRNLPAIIRLRMKGIIIELRVAEAPPESSFYLRLWRTCIIPFVDRFVCNSAYIEGLLKAQGVPSDKLLIIRNIAPARRQSTAAVLPRREDRIAFVGQIIPGKGLHLLIEAVGILAQRGLQANVLVIGSDTRWEHPSYAGYRDSLTKLIRKLGVEDRIEFVGEREDVPALLAASAIHCCPSLPELREAFGIVVVEAKMAGIPSVIFKSGGLPELVRHRVDGWICEAATAIDLAEGLEYFLQNPQLRIEAAAQAKVSSEEFSREIFRQQCLRLIEKPHPRLH